MWYFSSDTLASLVTCLVSIVSSVTLITWEIVQYRHLITSDVEKPIARNLSNCIIMLGVADILASIATLLSVLNYLPGICFIQAQLTEIGVLSTILWTAAISIYHLYQIKSCALGRDVKAVAKGSNTLFLCLFSFCWGIPVTVELIALNLDFYSSQPDPYSWCLFKDSQYLWIFFMYGWVLLVFILNVTIWGLCYYYLKKIAPQASHKPTLRLLAGYSVAFWIAWTCPLLWRSWLAWGPEDDHVVDILRLGMSATVPLQGFFNLIIYGYFRKYDGNDDFVEEKVPLSADSE